MARRVMDARFVGAEGNDLRRLVEPVDRRLRLDLQAEHRAHLDRALVQEEIVLVQANRHIQCPLGGGHTGHMIDVRVRQQDVPDRQPAALGEGEQRRHLVARIDEDRFPGLLAADDEAVLEEGTNGLTLNYHGRE